MSAGKRHHLARQHVFGSLLSLDYRPGESHITLEQLNLVGRPGIQ